MEKEKIVVRIDKDLQAIVPGFLQNKAKDITTIQHALETEEWNIIEMLGHRMKGAGGGYGFDEISRIGAEIEQAAKQEDTKKIGDLLKALESYLVYVEICYE